MGGLGNQLFQIFTTISCAIRYNIPLCFPPGFKNETRHTYWDSFLKALEPFSGKEISTNAYVYKDSVFHYVPIPIPSVSQKDIQLIGYFQSPLFFKDHWEMIIRMIRFKEICTNVQEKYPEYPISGSKNTISLHFRLGDYKNLQQFHPILSKYYYIKSIAHIVSPANSYLIYYFCEEEDNSTVSETIQELKNIFTNCTFVKVADSIQDWEQMVLMSLCQHHIIANSTFSWWGAYFSRVFTEDSITCYPKQWFGPALTHNNTNDLFPPEWILIE
jgi:hypothetical protein